MSRASTWTRGSSPRVTNKYGDHDELENAAALVDKRRIGPNEPKFRSTDVMSAGQVFSLIPRWTDDDPLDWQIFSEAVEQHDVTTLARAPRPYQNWFE
jgi:hypothetical protein